MDELNLGADWEQSKRLVKHWHDRWAKAQLKVDWYEAPESVRYTVQMYSELDAEGRSKIDNLMKALAALRPTPPTKERE